MNNYKWLSELNKEQKDSAISKGNVCVVARAGTGKTKALIARVIHQINEYNINPNNIIILSFTNKAANEIKDRLRKFDCRVPFLTGTFHSVSLKLMKKNEFLFGNRSPKSIILDDIDANNFIKDNVLNCFSKKQENYLKSISPNGKIPTIKKMAKDFLELVSILKTCLITPDMLLNGDTSDFPKIVIQKLNEEENIISVYLLEEFYKKYEDELLKAECLDFNDIINIPLKVMEEDKNKRDIIAKQFKSVIVDEHQDSNISQVRYLDAISKYSELYTVGDDGQSIYGWRGASVGFIRERLLDKNLTPFSLFQNYRSDSRILDLATMVLEYDKDVSDVKIKASGKNATLGDTPILIEYDNIWNELRGLVNNIKEISLKSKYSNIAVLCRTRNLARRVIAELGKNKIPFISDEWTLWTNKEIKFITSIISVAENLNKNNATIYMPNIISGPIKTGIGEVKLNKLLIDINKLGVIDGLEKYTKEKGVKKELQKIINVIKKTHELLCEFTGEIPINLNKNKDTIDKSNNYNLEIFNQKESNEINIDNNKYDTLSKIIEFIYEETGLKKAIKEKIDIAESNFKMFTMQDKLYGEAQELYLKETRKKTLIEEDFILNICHNLTLDEFKDQSTLSSRQKQKEPDYDGIKVMTIHSSKGLEFENVFIVGCSEKVMNTFDKLSPNYGESCRLLYVAITRAEKRLFLSYSQEDGTPNGNNYLCHLLEDIPNNILKIINKQ